MPLVPVLPSSSLSPAVCPSLSSLSSLSVLLLLFLSFFV
ncbi:hypothetical protein SLEP1_g55344 [Rubroshorea leprosula]|uniref:Uncharacterized protein n=1 Tax=Rubroshorea leprosula TaxID=152421 RepID=A0AAV5MI44_9ROSI|nr:hypothetical protein SLEP1_g55344 [Rubroshorea leprosula]